MPLDVRMPRCGKCTPCRKTLRGEGPVPCVLWREPAPEYVPTRQVHRASLPTLARELAAALGRHTHDAGPLG